MEDTAVSETIILKCVLRKLARRAWAGLIRLRIGATGGALVHGN
jgi:hypothetical protein